MSDLVRERISGVLSGRKATYLVSSAACGADLLALEAARELNIGTRIVLPFAGDIFRETSVADRPGDWGNSYDRITVDAERAGDLLLLGCSKDDPAAYAAANKAILDEATTIARSSGLPLAAVIVWDGKSRGPDDLTEQFQKGALERQLPVIEVSTLK